MPASVRLSESRILVAMRCRGGERDFRKAQNRIDLFASGDNGASWAHFNRPVPNTGFGGNPPTLTKLQDGRLCLTYGYRAEPYGIRAKLSGDGGATWGEEIVLRDDGGSHDLGYPSANHISHRRLSRNTRVSSSNPATPIHNTGPTNKANTHGF